MNEIKKKSDRWWYRLLQVLYISLLLIAIVGTLTEQLAPPMTVNPYSSRYEALCNDGTRIGNYSGIELAYGFTDFDSGNEQKFIRFACSRTDLTVTEQRAEYEKMRQKTVYTPVDERQGFWSLFNSSEQSQIIPDKKNYQIVLVTKEYQGTWFEALTLTVLWLVTIVVVATLVRSLFLYILFKESFIENMLFPFKRYLIKKKTK